MRRLIVVIVFALFGLTLPLPAAGRAGEAASAALQAARAKVATSDSAGALRDLQTYVLAHPSDVEAARFLGDLYLRLPDVRRAEATWKAIVERFPGDWQTHERLGRLYAGQNRVDDAIAEYERSLPSRVGFAGLVEEHSRRGDLADFRAQYERNAEDAPFDARAHWLYGNVLRAMHEYDLAQRSFERAVSLAPKDCPTLADAGNNLIDLARLNDALRYLARCLAIEPTNYAANVDAGEAYVELKSDGEAQLYLERALESRPDGSEALVDLGYLEDDRGEWATAVGYYHRAMNADPLESAAYVDLGYDYHQHHLYDLAKSAFIAGLSVAPNNGRLHYMLAATYCALGQPSLARDQYQLAIASKEPLVVRAARAELALLPAPQ